MALGKRAILQKIKDDLNMDKTPQIFFWKSEWENFDISDRVCNVSLPYLTFRCGMFLFFFIGHITTFACSFKMKFYFIYLTNWTFFIQLIYNSLYFFRLLWVWFQRRSVENRLFPDKQDEKLPWVDKIIWMFISVLCVIPYVVSAFYWVIIAPFMELSKFNGCETATTIFTHALNSPLAFIDLMVMAVPVRITHMIFPLIVGAIYVIFSGLYEASHGPYPTEKPFIYGVLNWREKAGYAVLAGILGVICGAFLHLGLGYGFYKLRHWLAFKYLKIKERAGEKNSLRISPSENNLDDVEKSKQGSVGGYDNPVVESKDYRTFTDGTEQKI